MPPVMPFLAWPIFADDAGVVARRVRRRRRRTAATAGARGSFGAIAAALRLQRVERRLHVGRHVGLRRDVGRQLRDLPVQRRQRRSPPRSMRCCSSCISIAMSKSCLRSTSVRTTSGSLGDAQRLACRSSCRRRPARRCRRRRARTVRLSLPPPPNPPPPPPPPRAAAGAERIVAARLRRPPSARRLPSRRRRRLRRVRRARGGGRRLHAQIPARRAGCPALLLFASGVPRSRAPRGPARR